MRTQEGDMELEFPGFVALLLIAACLLAPVAGVKVTSTRLSEIGKGAAEAPCLVATDDEAGFRMTPPGVGIAARPCRRT